MKTNLLALAVASAFGSAQANPYGANVVAGQASISSVGNTLTVINSAGSIINWQGFSIGQGETTRFIQPSASSAVLNRVLGADPSLLKGTLASNGRVFLVNPAGIFVGPDARIDVASVVFSTLNLTDANFRANRLKFDAVPNAGPVVNQGTIRTADGGTAYLVGARVDNLGSVQANAGTVVLAAGETVEIGDSAMPGLKVEVSGTGRATNLGEIVARAGTVGIVGAMVENRGRVIADSVTREGGRIFLRASGVASVDGGTLSARGETGGRIQIEGATVALGGATSIDASGRAGGGVIVVGGGVQGRDPEVGNSRTTTVGPEVSLRADATEAGDGGRVVVWSDGTTSAAGTISARGGRVRGDGGFVEVSGKQHLEFDATVSTMAPAGRTGILLLDPTDITIYSGSGAPGAGFAGGVYSGAAASSSSLYWDDITAQMAQNNVVIQTQSSGSGTGDITVANGVNFGSPNSLSLLAENNLTVQSGATIQNSGSGAMTLVAGWNPASGYATPTIDHPGTVGNMVINAGVSSGGPVTLAAKGSITINNPVVSLSSSVRLEAGGDVAVNFPSTANFSYVDDDYFEYIFPSGFSFPFFGTSYDRAYISSNGLITFVSGTSAYSNSLGGLGSYRVISPAWNDWEINTSLRQTIEITRPTGNELAVKWDVGRYYQTGQSAIFEAVLNRSNGNIGFNYGRTATNYDASRPSYAGDVTIGLANGSAASVIGSQLMNLANFSMDNLRSTTFVPSGGSYTETLSATGGVLRSAGAVLYSSDQGFAFGNVSASNFTALQAATTMAIVSRQGRVYGFGGITTPNLSVQAATGAALEGRYNQVSRLSASVGSGGLAFEDHWAGGSGALEFASAQVGGNLSVTNYGATTVATEAPGVLATGDVIIAANSPLSIGAFGISSSGGGAISLAANNSGTLTLAGPVRTSGRTSLVGGSVNGASLFAPGADINGLQGSGPLPAIPEAVLPQQQSVVSSLDSLDGGPGVVADRASIVSPGAAYVATVFESTPTSSGGATLVSGTSGGGAGEFGGPVSESRQDNQGQEKDNGQRGKSKSQRVSQCN